MTLGSIDEEDAEWRPDGKITVALSGGNTFTFGPVDQSLGCYRLFFNLQLWLTSTFIFVPQ